ncbi:MAG: hypothetical protein J0L92_22475 [Deltaproteobacteria bacterium]|nr:hypothetical protein [Deltaproteobacteria bacterium]
MSALRHDDVRVWISIVASTATVMSACDGSEGTWHRCSGVPPSTRSRGSGDSLECLCEPGWVCNYNQVLDARWPTPDEGVLDAAVLEDAGFSEAGPIDDAAIDALSAIDVGPADAAGSMDDASLDALVTDDALVVHDVGSP